MRLAVDLMATVPDGGEINIRGSITEVLADPADHECPGPFEAVQAWLANIDAGELERVTLEQMGMGSTFTQEILVVLRRWASGST